MAAWHGGSSAVEGDHERSRRLSKARREIRTGDSSRPRKLPAARRGAGGSSHRPVTDSSLPVAPALGRSSILAERPMVRFLEELDGQGRPQVVVSWRDLGHPSGDSANGTGTSFEVFAVNGWFHPLLAPPIRRARRLPRRPAGSEPPHRHRSACHLCSPRPGRSARAGTDDLSPRPWRHGPVSGADDPSTDRGPGDPSGRREGSRAHFCAFPRTIPHG